MGDDSVGSVLFVVQRTIAPMVDVLMFTETDCVYMPDRGLKVGVATFWRTVYVPAARSLAPIPVLNARARSVAVVVNVKRPQTSDEFVGAVPSVVQRIVAPLVGVTRLTMTEPVKIPGVGLRSGAAIFWTGSYDADATALGAIPLLKARALTVVDQLKITVPRYSGEASEGSQPSVVY